MDDEYEYEDMWTGPTEEAQKEVYAEVDSALRSMLAPDKMVLTDWILIGAASDMDGNTSYVTIHREDLPMHTKLGLAKLLGDVVEL